MAAGRDEFRRFFVNRRTGTPGSSTPPTRPHTPATSSLSENPSHDTGDLLGINEFDDPNNPQLPFFGRHNRVAAGAGRDNSAVTGDNGLLYPAEIREQLRAYTASSGPADEQSRSWKCRPELPTSDEVLDLVAEWQPMNASGEIIVGTNKIEGAWDSKESYLQTHYELLREEAVRPLREAVTFVKLNPYAAEQDGGRNHNLGIYDKVHICGATLSTRGLGIRISFSLSRVGKKIQWEQSSRLITGSIVALSPAADSFNTRCVVAVVAGRNLDRLKENPPKIDIFFARSEEVEIDPAQEWLMVEERTGFYEAQRHTMVALHRMVKEPLFPLSEHILDVQPHVYAPKYIVEQPCHDMSDVFRPSLSISGDFRNMNVLENWPKEALTDLDDSQLSALQQILTKRLAIVQGPPGTGKTFVSVTAIKALLTARQPSDPPIIIACQTNHALDQLLRLVAVFEPSFARIGGRSKDTGVIQARTLFNLRQDKEYRKLNVPGGQRVAARNLLRTINTKLIALLKPLDDEVGLIDHKALQKLDVLTAEQCESIERGNQAWAGEVSSDAANATQPLIKWLGQHAVQNKYYTDEDFGWNEYEDEFLEMEVLQEREAENAVVDDDFDTLHGEFVSLGQQYSGKQTLEFPDSLAESLLKKSDLWKVPVRHRGPLFNYMMKQAKQRMLDGFRGYAERYTVATRKWQVGGWEKDLAILRKQKLVGMTTTGVSKYRALLDSLNPRVVMIEEAAEALEAPVVAACVRSLEHLILVGDHKQLRPNCSIKALEGDPVYLNVSLFERLINQMEYSVLQRQRRMIPEIRRLLHPIYGSTITDHPSVKDTRLRPPVPGMGGVNSFLYIHHYEESKDEYLSTANPQEANMIVGFFEHLIHNGIPPEKITVLTFYNGQRKLIHKKLKVRPDIAGYKVNVVTVDSYQGEENDVVLLSLVRSNTTGAIGFVGVDNRICVALSRAKRGCYIFGNMDLLAEKSDTWEQVFTIMSGKKSDNPAVPPKCRTGEAFPIVCENHGKRVLINDPDDWSDLSGGCLQHCGATLPCGHECDLRCHPFTHDNVNCFRKCQRELPCGHPCLKNCWEKCICAKCFHARVGSEREVKKPDSRLAAAEPNQNEENKSTQVLGQFVNGRAMPADRKAMPSGGTFPPKPADRGIQNRALPRQSSAPTLNPFRETSPGRHIRREAPNINDGLLTIQKRTTAGAWNRFAAGGVREDDRLRALSGAHRPAGLDGYGAASALHQAQSATKTPPIKPRRNSPTVARNAKVIRRGRRKWTDTIASKENVEGDSTMNLIDLSESLPLHNAIGSTGGDNANGAISSPLSQTLSTTNAQGVRAVESAVAARSNTTENLIDLADFHSQENQPSPQGEHGNNTMPQPAMSKRESKLPQHGSLIDLD